MERIAGVLFDKDGTLFDFTASWGAWTRALLAEFAAGDPALTARLAGLLGFDPTTGRFVPGSPVVTHTTGEIAAMLLPFLPGRSLAAVVARLDLLATRAPMVEAVPLAPLLGRLRARGLHLGLATNDSEVAARAHLRAAGVEAAFDFVAGYDSGHGGKPGPGMLLAFARAMGLPPAAVLMVGDSRHDLEAARAAGMPRVAVLTGPATAGELAPFAEAVLPDIGHLPDWLDARARG